MFFQSYLCPMIFSSSLLENAVNEFAKLPGIGKKTALRLVLHLLKQNENDVNRFSEVIAKMRLIRESTTQRNVSQGFRAFEHQSGSKRQSL